jgi:multiple sugar transport system permease protein
VALVTTPPEAAGGSRPRAPGAGRRPGRGRRTASRGRRLFPYLLLVPAIALELLIHLVPMVVGAWMSLRQLNQFSIRDWSAAPFIGLDNYRIAVDVSAPVGAELLHSFWVTLAYSVVTVTLCWLFGLAGAVFLHKPFRGRGLLRTLFLVPYALPLYTAFITWSFAFQRDTGMVNAILVDQFHASGDRPFWLIGGNSFAALVVSAVWRNWPFAFLCLMAALQNVPGEMYEAAALDGAGFWARLRHVTLPMLRPVNLVLVLVLFLWTFNDFTAPYVLFGGSAPHAADLISIHIYSSSFVTWDFGAGSAMSVLLLLFLLLVTAGYLWLTGRGRDDDA